MRKYLFVIGLTTIVAIVAGMLLVYFQVKDSLAVLNICSDDSDAMSSM